MSAFLDIWISSAGSNYRPQHTRKENLPWAKKDIGVLDCWQSYPAGKKFDFIQEVQNATHRLIVLGQFYEPININSLLSDCQAYVTLEASSFHAPSGHYILFLVDNRDTSLYVFTNRLGTYHAYYSLEPGQGSISTYYLGLAKQVHDKELDWEGITGFFGMGFFQNDNTHLKNVKIILPASCYHFDRSLKLKSHKRYWDWNFNSTVRTEKEYTAMLHEALAASVNYAIKNRTTALPISGGLDSRTLAGVMTGGDGKDNKIWGYSYGYTPKSVETDIAARIADARGIQFDSYVVPNYLFDKIDLISKSIELFGYVDGPRQASMKELLEEKSELVIGGHWGDVWLDDMGIAALPGSRNEQLMAAFDKKILKRGSDWLMSVSELYFPNGKQFLRGYYQDFVEQYKHVEDADHVMKIFKTDQWSFRWTLPSIRMYQAAVFPVLPFYDNRIVDLFQTVPTNVLSGRSLQIEYLKQYHPDLARIKWQEYDSNLYWYKYLNNRNLVYRIYKKLGRTLKGERPIQRSWEIFYLNTSGRQKLEEVFMTPAFNSVIPDKYCKELLDNFYQNPSAGNGYAISMLHTFARFIEQIS